MLITYVFYIRKNTGKAAEHDEQREEQEWLRESERERLRRRCKKKKKSSTSSNQREELIKGHEVFVSSFIFIVFYIYIYYI